MFIWRRNSSSRRELVLPLLWGVMELADLRERGSEEWMQLMRVVCNNSNLKLKKTSIQPLLIKILLKMVVFQQLQLLNRRQTMLSKWHNSSKRPPSNE